MQEIKEDCKFKNYEHFIRHDKSCLKNTSHNDIKFLHRLIKLIEKKKIYNCDEETPVEFNTGTFYHNIDNELVIMNYRQVSRCSI